MLNKECSTLIHKDPLKKLKDPCIFFITCVIGGCKVGKALCDLGASVSIMLYSLCKKLNLGEPKPTSMTIQLVDRSVKQPVGILEDVPIMIDRYFIHEDFVILDIEVPIILGRPFMATTGTIIDVRRGKLVMEIIDEKVDFDIFQKTNDRVPYVDELISEKEVEEQD